MSRNAINSYILGVAAIIFLCTGINIAASKIQRAYKVLVINSYHPAYRWTANIMNGIESAVEEYSGIIELDVEYMDTREKVDDSYYKSLCALYKYKADRKKYDVIITTDNNALLFVLQHRRELYPGVPVVFCGINGFDKSMIEGHELVTGVTEEEILEPTLETAIKLHRLTKTVVVVLHGSQREFEELEQIREAIRKEGQLVELIKFSIGEVITKEKMEERMSGLWDKAVILFGVPFRNPRGHGFSFEETSPIIRQHPNTPMYAIAEEWFDHCPIIGGKLNSGYDQGLMAARMTMRILDGQKADDIPIVFGDVDRYFFDYNKLRQFGIPYLELPEQSVIINEPKSFYYHYKKGIWTVSGIVFCLVLAVLFLSASAVRLKKTQELLLGYQSKLRSLASKLSLTEERERRRIATELHDRISQSLVISKVKLEVLREYVSSGFSDERIRTLNEVCDYLGQTISDARSLTFDLSSPVLRGLGFEAALADWLSDNLEKKYGITTKFADDGQPKPLSDDVSTLLYRGVPEVLINVIKHSHSHKVEVYSQRVNNQIQINIKDDGVGFDVDKLSLEPKTAGESDFGIFGIRERLEQLEGRLLIKSEVRKGTIITITAPLKQA